MDNRIYVNFCYIYSSFFVAVLDDFDTKYHCIYYMALTANNSIVVCGEPHSTRKPDWNKDIRSLSRFSIPDGKTLRKTELKSEILPDGIANVIFGETKCVALSCR